MCHDPHGISSSQGNSTNNTHLMNWDTTICLPNKNGLLEFIDLGVRTGACNVLCHNHQHKPSSY